jgi:hypothetical protein
MPRFGISTLVSSIHGLGFAGALSQVGVPEHEVPLSLLMFNFGVETGQIAFVSVVALTLAAIRPLLRAAPDWPRSAATYAIGSVAAFWTIERVLLL